ncbi:MAG: hypothetical protein LBJ58_06165 [Tannerellaceae bacterium]|jgi:hypothetical protein|nr:hypothetical protein [Tannerellaceae bacterium]
MKIALLLKNKKQHKVEDFDHAVVFDIEKDKVVGVENAMLGTKDVDALTSWAEKKKIKEIYTPQVDESLRLFFGTLGIILKGYDELSDNPLFQTFIFA